MPAERRNRHGRNANRRVYNGEYHREPTRHMRPGARRGDGFDPSTIGPVADPVLFLDYNLAHDNGTDYYSMEHGLVEGPRPRRRRRFLRRAPVGGEGRAEAVQEAPAPAPVVPRIHHRLTALQRSRSPLGLPPVINSPDPNQRSFYHFPGTIGLCIGDPKGVTLLPAPTAPDEGEHGPDNRPVHRAFGSWREVESRRFPRTCYYVNIQNSDCTWHKPRRLAIYDYEAARIANETDFIGLTSEPEQTPPAAGMPLAARAAVRAARLAPMALAAAAAAAAVQAAPMAQQVPAVPVVPPHRPAAQ